MNASDWKQKAQAESETVLTLPSGMQIRARRPAPMQMAMWDLLPFGLVNAAAGIDPRPDSAIPSQVMIDRMVAMRDLLIYCCINPRVTLTPASDEEIHPRDIPDADLTFILRWAMRVPEATRMESFRREPGDAGGGGNGEGVRTAPVVPISD